MDLDHELSVIQVVLVLDFFFVQFYRMLIKPVPNPIHQHDQTALLFEILQFVEELRFEEEVLVLGGLNVLGLQEPDVDLLDVLLLFLLRQLRALLLVFGVDQVLHILIHDHVL